MPPLAAQTQNQLTLPPASIDTRPAGQARRHGGLDSDEDFYPLMMEVRARIKSQPSEAVTMSQLVDQNSLPPNLSFASQGFSAIGDKIKQLHETLGELQTLGIQQDVSLPELVLVGDQSAGKSSLMSAFSGICIPRAEGACTRCPIHIRLSQAARWSCKISLHDDYQYRPAPNAGGRVAAPRVTKTQPFGPWFPKPRVVKDFTTFDKYEPESVEQALRWAQTAILNPTKDHTMFRPGIGPIWKTTPLDDAETQTEAAFSPNAVALDVSGPGLVDLSFYDLPGVFKNARLDEDEYLVKVVENLAAKYIGHEQAIIIWAVPMNADPENSSTFSIIRQKGAQARTVGVMTKADLLPPGGYNQWLSMLRGQQHRVGRGYFITARPSGVSDRYPDEILQRQLQREEPFIDDLARQAAFEEGFFNRALPPMPGGGGLEWPEYFKEVEDRCGVSRLTVFLSNQLGLEFGKR